MKVELSLAVSLALLLIPLSFTDDIVNPNPYTLVYSGHGSGVFPLPWPWEWYEIRSGSLLLHVNDTVSLELRFSGCNLRSGVYEYRVVHYSSGKIYAARGEVGALTLLPVFTAELGGVHVFQLRVKLEGEGECRYDLRVTATREDKSGYARVYTLEAAAGLVSTSAVAAYVAVRRREAA
mgnify:CR=1 FL=1